jgi:hypothetical protein
MFQSLESDTVNSLIGNQIAKMVPNHLNVTTPKHDIHDEFQ